VHILIVEDNRKLSASLVAGLEQDGYTVDAAFDGIEAEGMIVGSPESYDLVVLDVMLPELDGFGLCRKVREAGVTVPILMLTAKDAIDARVEGLDAGADDYLGKPFSFAELSARVRALLRRPRNAVPTTLRVGEIELDPAKRSVRVAGTEIEVTLKEFQLLRLFMMHPGQVLSRSQIVERLWDFGSDLYSNAVDVHVKNLRKKIGGQGDAQTIETVRGIGYRLKA